MRTRTIESIAALRKALGATSPPTTITQEAFDHDDDHLRRLVNLEPGEPATPADLSNYAQDLRYTEIQPELLTYLLPVCLQAWHDDLRGTRGYGAFVEHFYPVLADRHVFDRHLTPEQTAAVSEFMRGSILSEIDAQRGLASGGMNARPYRWIGASATYGVLLPDIERLWTDWWALGTTGRAVASVQYISALMYPNDANPIFAPWTRDEGGGPPCLWEFEGNLYSHRWLEPNADFLRRTLNVPTVSGLLERSVKALTGEAEYELASRVLADLPDRNAMLAARCIELPVLLATTQDASSLLEWSA
jgi:hypothetical protein